MLEERNTYTRLQREFEMIDNTRKQLEARTVLKESFHDIKENKMFEFLISYFLLVLFFYS